MRLSARCGKKLALRRVRYGSNRPAASTFTYIDGGISEGFGPTERSRQILPDVTEQAKQGEVCNAIDCYHENVSVPAAPYATLGILALVIWSAVLVAGPERRKSPVLSVV
jgi:hypothetical protein